MIEELLRSTFTAVDAGVPDGIVDAAVLEGYRQRNRRRHSAIAALAVSVVVALATTAFVVDHRDGRVPPVVQVKPPASSVRTMTTSPLTTTTFHTDLGLRLLPIGSVVAAIPDEHGVDVIVQPDPAVGVSIVERIDPRSGAVLVRGPTVDDARTMVRTQNWIWINTSPLAPTGGHHAALLQLDPRTLSIHRAVELPEEWATLTGAGDLLWVGTADRIYRLDPTTGVRLRTVTLEPQDPGAVAGVALDPDQQWLWVSETNVGLDVNHPNKSYDPLVITRRDPETGAIERSRRDVPSIAGGGLNPTHNGLWVAVSTGMLGAAYRFDPNLDQDAQWNGGRATGPNSTGITIVADRVWALDPVNRTLQCADPTTGAVLATRNVDNQLGLPIATINDELLIADNEGLVVASLHAVCP